MDFSNINLVNWAIIFLIIAVIAGLLGFGALAGTAMEAAKLLCGVALFLALLALLLKVL